jgi:hypothetical protein
MSANSTGVIRQVVDVVGLSTYSFSRQDDVAALTRIPPEGGTTLKLPAGSQSGDAYEAFDVDGSCDVGSPIVLVAPAGTTVRGGSSVTFVDPFSSLRAVFDETTSQWALSQSQPPSAAARHRDFVGNGTFTVPSGVTSFRALLWGGGGGGGNGAGGAAASPVPQAGGGGGGGALLVVADFADVASGDAFTVGVGAGGGSNGQGGVTSVSDASGFGVVAPGGSAGQSGSTSAPGVPALGGAPSTSQAQSVFAPRGMPGTGGAGGAGASTAQSGMDNAGVATSLNGAFLGGGPGDPGALGGSNAGGGGGGGGGAGPSGPGAPGGSGGAGKTSAAGSAGAAGHDAVPNTGAGGGAGGAGGNGTSGGPPGLGGRGGSGFVRIQFFA